MCDDRAVILDRPAPIKSNVQVDERLYIVTLDAPDIARCITPGQFVHMLIPGMEGHILRRPFSVLDADADSGEVEILYQVVGYGSAHLATLTEGAETRLMGPIGNSWQAPEGTKRALLVAGGVGAAPLFMHARALLEAGIEVDVCMGAQSAGGLVLKQRYTDLLGCEPVCATDDGTYGHHGFVTVPVQQALEANEYDYLACCGPEPMMRIIASEGLSHGVATYVSMEKRMACGIGACLSCVVDTVDGRKRSCVDGPVFDASKVVW